MRRKLISALMVAALALPAIPTIAGEIDSDLQAIMASTAVDQPISVLVFLNDQTDLQSLTATLDDRGATLRDRHETVVRALQEMATNTQGDMTAYLVDLKAQGTVSDFQPFWIVNACALTTTKEQVEIIAARPDVDKIYFNYEIETIEPVDEKTDGGTIARVETGLVAVRAPEVWAMGITGAGVLVSNIDTGVDGNHPALASRWAGVADSRYAGHPEWAWYDPYLGQNNFPYDNGGHGTHTMGTITGAAPSTGDTVGVAPGALWIAAGAIDRGGGISRTVADAISSFQWMLDPDGNPSTSWDVPDVCSNSWGLVTAHGYAPCDPTFWSYIDACEAAGTVVVFAAGNEGTSGLRRPADRATDAYRTCAVAAVDGNNPSWPIASFSSRGPTYCTPTGEAAIKPDIAAPGVNVRSSYPGGGYAIFSGTSMATPHVAGVIALIREANPNLTPDQIKQIIYDTAFDLGTAGEDNSYGWGMIDAYEAVLAAMGGAPPVAEFSGTPTSGCAPLSVNFSDQSSGDITSWSWTFGDGGTSNLQNPSHSYSNAGNYTVALTVSGPTGSDTNTKTNYISVSDVPTAAFTGSPTTGCAPLTVNFSDQSTGGATSWSWNFGEGGSSSQQNPSYVYQNAGSYTVALTASNACGSDIATMVDYIVVDPPCGTKSFALSDIPTAGVVSGSYVNTHTSDNSYESITEIESGGKPSNRYSYLDHRWNFNVVPGATAILNVEAYRPNNADGDDFVFEYSLNNSNFTPLLTVTSALEQAYQAAFPTNVSGIVYIRVSDTDRTAGNRSFDPVYIDYMFIESDGTPPPPFTMHVNSVTVSRVADKGNRFRAEAVVNVLDQAGAAVAGALVIGDFSGPSIETQSGITGTDGSAVIVSQSVRNPVGTWCFGVTDVMLGSNIYDPSQNLETSDCEALPKLGAELPSGFAISQNYPNPFNPATEIKVEIPAANRVNLEIYNLVGQKLTTLADEYLEAGSHTFIWDGTVYPSGVYFYRLRVGDISETRKMLLLK